MLLEANLNFVGKIADKVNGINSMALGELAICISLSLIQYNLWNSIFNIKSTLIILPFLTITTSVKYTIHKENFET